MNYKKGMAVTCYIKDIYIKDAKLQYFGEEWYICQNLMSGNYCGNTLGYEYSWVIGNGNHLNAYEVSDLKPKFATQYEKLKFMGFV